MLPRPLATYLTASVVSRLKPWQPDVHRVLSSRKVWNYSITVVTYADVPRTGDAWNTSIFFRSQRLIRDSAPAAGADFVEQVRRRWATLSHAPPVSAARTPRAV